MSTTSIDDILIGVKTNTQPSTPEKVNSVDDNIQSESIPEIEAAHEPESQYGIEDEQKESAPKAEAQAQPDRELDDYGNEQEKSKLYTKEEVDARINEAVRDRLNRLERNNNQQPAVAQQVQQGFEYDSNSADSWQQQLESFVENTVTKLSQKQAQQAQARQEQQVQAEFEDKFNKGMGKFKDYVDVVKTQPITDAMVLASRSLSDPAAFFYAAAKRAPQDLQRIAQLPDQYAQMVEIGKLEERMRKTKTATSAPKPLSRTQEDSTINLKSDRQPTIEELISHADAKKRAAQARRQR
jgi:hypothetical protein